MGKLIRGLTIGMWVVFIVMVMMEHIYPSKYIISMMAVLITLYVIFYWD